MIYEVKLIRYALSMNRPKLSLLKMILSSGLNRS